MLTTDLAALRPGLREDLAALPASTPGAVRRRLRPAWFKTDAPRHGAASRATSARSCRRSTCCGRTRSRVDHPLIDAQDVAALKAEILASGLSVSGAGVDGLGLGLDVPRHRQARRRQRRPHSPGAAEGLGGQPAGRAGQGAAEARSDPDGVQRPAAGGKKVSLADLIVLGAARPSRRPGR